MFFQRVLHFASQLLANSLESEGIAYFFPSKPMDKSLGGILLFVN